MIDLLWLGGKLIFLFALLWLVLDEIKRRRAEKTHFLFLLIVLVGLLVPTVNVIHDVVFPIVSSGKVYRQGSTFEKVGIQYKVILPHKIEDVDVFYVSGNGWRMDWVKYIDFRFKDNYIQSNHELNNAEGEYVIVYKYRTNMFAYPRLAREAKKSLSE